MAGYFYFHDVSVHSTVVEMGIDLEVECYFWEDLHGWLIMSSVSDKTVIGHENTLSKCRTMTYEYDDLECVTSVADPQTLDRGSFDVLIFLFSRCLSSLNCINEYLGLEIDKNFGNILMSTILAESSERKHVSVGMSWSARRWTGYLAIKLI